MIYYTGLDEKSRNTAGAKAPADIKELCRRRSYKYIGISATDLNSPKYVQRIYKVIYSVKFWKKLLDTAESGDIVIYQHPMFVAHMSKTAMAVLKARGVKFIALIHDLESLRKGISGVIDSNEHLTDFADNEFLMKFDAIICHNIKMKQYLVKKGFNPKKIVSLKIFDYLSDYIPEQKEKGEYASVAIAGNLSKGKCGYIYSIAKNKRNRNLKVNLFGVNFEEPADNNIYNYHGSFASEKLPEYLEGDFGLVWDGTSAKGCVGNTGEYLKYNNPHKVSLYLSSGFPVIIWKKAAMADFVLKNNVGIVVDNLYNLDSKINAITPEQYETMQKNTLKIASRLHAGYYFYRALDAALDIIAEKQ